MKKTNIKYSQHNSILRKLFFFIFIVLIILFMRYLSIWSKDVTLKFLILGSMLCITTILFSSFYGIKGAIISSASNAISATANYVMYFQDYDFFRLSVAIFMSSFIISNLIIGFLSQSRFKKENELILKGKIDALTQVYNHGHFLEAYEDIIDNCSKKNEKLCLIIIDIDNFKMINDYFGHKIGDEILLSFSNIIKSCVRDNDFVFRYGGDEFIILIPNANIDICKSICNAILKSANQYTNPNIDKFNQEYKLTASIGVSCYPSSSHTKSELLSHADIALYESKHSGRNKFTLYNSTVSAVIDDRLKEHYEYVKSLLLLIDSKDKYTYGHSLRVSSYASEFAEYIGLSKKEIFQLKLAGLMHDAGKVECDNCILRKTTPLTDAEWDILKAHPQASVTIVEKVISDQKILQAIMAHHEKYDGSGYPHGLKDENISYFAMIINIVDAYDAMRSLRVYSPSFSDEQAKDEIKRNMGKQFSPSIASKFIEYLDHVDTDSYERFNYDQTSINKFIGLNIDY